MGLFLQSGLILGGRHSRLQEAAAGVSERDVKPRERAPPRAFLVPAKHLGIDLSDFRQ